MQSDELTLSNLCGNRAVEEVFQRAVKAIYANIADVNTPAEQKRQATLVFDFTPFPDRRGAKISFSCKEKLAGVEAVNGTIFLSKGTDGQMHAFVHDPMQERLFANEPTPTDAKQ